MSDHYIRHLRNECERWRTLARSLGWVALLASLSTLTLGVIVALNF